MDTFFDFKTIFLSIIIEAFPFVLIGSFLASIIEVYVSEKTIIKILPKNPVLQAMAAGVIGVFIPLCECAIIPLAKRLIKKGVPVRTVLIFMLATPLINPIALSATYIAFAGRPRYLFYRIIFGLIVVCFVSVLFSRFKKSDVLKEEDLSDNDSTHECSAGCSCHEHHKKPHGLSKVFHIIKHTKNDFFDVGRFVIIGAIISSLFQVIFPEDISFTLKKYDVLSMIFLQGLGYVLSICSHADAFIAANFSNQFSFYAILAFLIISPLMDIKNSIVLFGSFNKRFSRLVIFRIFLVTNFIMFTIMFLKV